MKLPEQDHLDEAVGKLSLVTDAVDEVHKVAYRAGLARPHAASEHESVRQDTERILDGLSAQYAARLDDLRCELERGLRWVKAELKQIAG